MINRIVMVPVFQRATVFLALALALALLAAPTPTLAEGTADLSVSPVIISEKAKARDILKESIRLVNTSERSLSLYPSVIDVDPNEGGQGFDYADKSSERAASLANWIELSRGVIELGPGEEREVPFVIRINLNADPGMYYAALEFYQGPTRDRAEGAPPLATVDVTVEVQADIKEVLQLGSFFTDSIFLSGDDVLFNYQIENIGNQTLKPTGEIRIYDRTGAEVASIPVNSEGATFSPEQKAQLAAVWSAAEGFGKYKAFLNLDYGDTQRASLQDTVFFWIVPWKQLGVAFVVGLLVVIFLVYYYHRRLEAQYAVAHAGPRAPVVAPAPVPLAPKPKRRRSWLPSFKKREPTWQVAAEWHDAPETVHPEPSVTARHEVVATPVHGETINLKHMRPQPKSEHHVTHVINLKK